jgi:FtsP/CotA-like multicopper oxidase with cupredoxin domain
LVNVNFSYSYRFIADTPGTHWYHGHLMTDRADGLAGGFIVKMPNETFPDGNGNRITVDREYYYLLQV